MGAAVSSGQNNDELVNNLMKSGYIRTRKVEQVFRAVDRADYVLPSHRDRAYNDLAWKHGNIHLSAPCIYSEVMESLSLEPGLSFLNLGSGTGYLSTMAGLILNQHGTNHGIELHEDCLEYAYERLEEFKQKSLALDEFDFCEPVFIQGNCLNVAPGRQYDRVYCGAACPENYEGFIKQFVCIGGILVMPFKDHLLRVLRIDEDTWLHFKMLPVSFATLVVPTTTEQTLFHLPECVPLSLQELCRGKIRRCLRLNVWKEHEDLETEKVILLEQRRFNSPQQTLTRFVIPVLGESDGSVSDESASDEDDEFTRRVCVLLSVDADPRDLYTTSQVRAVVLCNMNENQNWQVVNNNGNVDWYNQNSENSANSNKSVSRTEEGNDEQTTSNSTEEKSQNKSELQNFTNVSETYLNLLKHTETLLNISESDSETEQDETLPVQRKKMAKREKTDSGIVEDVNLSNEDSSPRSNTSQSDSKPVESPDSTNAMDVDPSDVSRDQEVIIARYVNSNAFSTYMKEKIQELPLPFSSKLYLNYNRKL